MIISEASLKPSLFPPRAKSLSWKTQSMKINCYCRTHTAQAQTICIDGPEKGFLKDLKEGLEGRYPRREALTGLLVSRKGNPNVCTPY